MPRSKCNNQQKHKTMEYSFSIIRAYQIITFSLASCLILLSFIYFVIKLIQHNLKPNKKTILYSVLFLIGIALFIYRFEYQPKLFIDKNYGIKFFYPNDWVIKENYSESDGSKTKDIFIHSNIYKDDLKTIDIKVKTKESLPKTTIQIWWLAEFEARKLNKENILNFERVTTYEENGITYAKNEGTLRDISGTITHYKTKSFNKNGKHILLVFGASPGIFESKHTKDFEMVENTIKVY